MMALAGEAEQLEHLASAALERTPSTLNPTPYILHPKPYNLHPTP